MLALGRSSMLFDTIVHLSAKGVRFRLIVTSQANPEYACGPDEFEALAKRIHSDFLVLPGKDRMGDVERKVRQLDIHEGITVNWPHVLDADFIHPFASGFLLNLHFGRLPDYKGNATFNWMILRGEKEGYADIHHVVEALDAGDIVARKRIGLADDQYVGDLLSEVEQSAPDLFEGAISSLRNDPSFIAIPNSEKGLRCYPRTDADGRIDWNWDAERIDRLIRASSLPFPCAWCYYDTTVVRVIRARSVSWEEAFLAQPGSILSYQDSGHVAVSCGRGVLMLEEVATDDYRGTPRRLLTRFRTRLL